MSPPLTTLPLTRIVSNSGQLSQVPGLHEDNLERDVGLIIRFLKPLDQFLLFPYGKLFPPPKTWDTEIPLTPLQLFRHVEDCRQVWQDVVVNYQEVGPNPAGGMRNVFPFQEWWDFRERPELLRAAGPRLALAGAQLFYHLFEASGDPVLTEVAQRLRDEGRKKPLVLTVTSDTFFVPWGMLYVHPDPSQGLAPDGANFQWEGFWGFRHIVEHNPKYVSLETELKPNQAGRIPLSINIDERIDQTLNVPCIAPQLDFFQRQSGLELIERRQKGELQKAFMAAGFADRVVYFCCHGTGASGPDTVNLQRARIALTDGLPITDADISFWLKGRPGLVSQPVVFINACQGGQLTTIFYQTLATEFLKQKAIGLIGAQIDIPAVFAAEYSQRFFDRFLNGGPGNRVRMGPLMQELAREFITKHHNPLGLVYSLYRGADCFVRW